MKVNYNFNIGIMKKKIFTWFIAIFKSGNKPRENKKTVTETLTLRLGQTSLTSIPLRCEQPNGNEFEKVKYEIWQNKYLKTSLTIFVFVLNKWNTIILTTPLRSRFPLRI